MLCLIAQTPRRNFITYEEFYKYAWDEPHDKSKENYIEAVQKQFEVISSTLFKDLEEREEYIWTAPKKGYQAADDLKMVIRLETKK